MNSRLLIIVQREIYWDKKFGEKMYKLVLFELLSMK